MEVIKDFLSSPLGHALYFAVVILGINFLILKIFGNKKVEDDFHNDLDKQYFNSIYQDLKLHPEYYTSRWSIYGNINKSIQKITNRDNDFIIQIMETGEIINPVNFYIPKEELYKMKKLVEKVIERDRQILFDIFKSNLDK